MTNTFMGSSKGFCLRLVFICSIFFNYCLSVCVYVLNFTTTSCDRLIYARGGKWLANLKTQSLLFSEVWPLDGKKIIGYTLLNLKLNANEWP